MKRTVLATALAALLLGLQSPAMLAADATQAQPPIYGSQLMNPEERLEYRNKMRGLRTQEEREAFRAEHHKAMQERAKEKGLALPDEPPARGMGRGPGMGPGGGMGPGAGMGSGAGRGPGPGGPNR